METVSIIVLALIAGLLLTSPLSVYQGDFHILEDGTIGWTFVEQVYGGTPEIIATEQVWFADAEDRAITWEVAETVRDGDCRFEGVIRSGGSILYGGQIDGVTFVTEDSAGFPILQCDLRPLPISNVPDSAIFEGTVLYYQKVEQDPGPDPAYCGDGTCNGDETEASCSADCGSSDPYCGDGACNGQETKVSCSEDCGADTCEDNGFYTNEITGYDCITKSVDDLLCYECTAPDQEELEFPTFALVVIGCLLMIIFFVTRR